MTFLIYIILCIYTVNFVSSYSLGECNNRVMVWLCLEFCDENASDTRRNLIEIEKNKEVISAVSFEKYTLGPNSTLVDNNLTFVSDTINAMGLEAWPLLSSYPHYPEFMEWMREVFADPYPFMMSCVNEALKYKYVGYNLDWEPTTDDITDEDGLNYATFIETFNSFLNKYNLKLSVDIATWSPIWNYTAIAATSVPKAISMGTYTATDTSFTKQLDLLIDAFGPDRSGVGLEYVNATSGERLPLDEINWRFQQITDSGAVEIDIWRMPVPPLWLPLITKYKNCAA